MLEVLWIGVALCQGFHVGVVKELSGVSHALCMLLHVSCVPPVLHGPAAGW
jgi:hypothetical protein